MNGLMLSAFPTKLIELMFGWRFQPVLFVWPDDLELHSNCFHTLFNKTLIVFRMFLWIEQTHFARTPANTVTQSNEFAWFLLFFRQNSGHNCLLALNLILLTPQGPISPNPKMCVSNVDVDKTLFWFDWNIIPGNVIIFRNYTVAVLPSTSQQWFTWQTPICRTSCHMIYRVRLMPGSTGGEMIVGCPANLFIEKLHAIEWTKQKSGCVPIALKRIVNPNWGAATMTHQIDLNIHKIL